MDERLPSEPILRERLARLLGNDTSPSRLIISAGMMLLGACMIANTGPGSSGYRLFNDAAPIQAWGLLYAAVGAWGLYGSVKRLGYWHRIAITAIGMHLWALLAFAQIADWPSPARILLILPAIVEVWVLVKAVVIGPRTRKEEEQKP